MPEPILTVDPAIATSSDDLIAAVDLGSNSFHMVLARHGPDGLRIVERHKERVRLAAGLDESNRLSSESRRRALEALARFGERLGSLPHDHVRVVGTATLRRASNARAFIVGAETALGHPLDVVSGREEARLIWRGVAADFSESETARLVIDIGGGSTEFIRGRNVSLLRAESIGLGCVGITREWFGDGKLTAARWRQASAAVVAELGNLRESLELDGGEECFGSSGTIRAAADVARIAGWCGDELDARGLERLRTALLEAGDVGKLELEGLSKNRRPVFAGGVLLLGACFDVLGIARLRISKRALREGLLADVVDSLPR